MIVVMLEMIINYHDVGDDHNCHDVGDDHNCHDVGDDHDWHDVGDGVIVTSFLFVFTSGSGSCYIRVIVIEVILWR